MKPAEYKKLVQKNMTKEYKKVTLANADKISKAHKSVVNDLDLQDRVFKSTDLECFISLKDHKDDFQNTLSSRLLNPMKCEIGKISHSILSKFISEIRSKCDLNQWQNTYACVEWFKTLENKEKLHCLRYCEFLPINII